MPDTTNPTSAELLAIIERARAEREAREALNRYWAAVATMAPKPSDFPCTSGRQCLATRHDGDCPIGVAERINKKGATDA